MENNKYQFLNQMVMGMVDSIDKNMLETNITRLLKVDERVWTVEPQLGPEDPEFMPFYLLYLLLVRFTISYIQKLALQNNETANPKMEKLALFANCLQDGIKPFNIVDFAKILSQDMIPADSYSLSGGYGGDYDKCQVPVSKLDFFCGLLPDILYSSITKDNKVKTLPDMCQLAIDYLSETVKRSTTIKKDKSGHFQLPF
jgi:hypothetical protein